MSAKFSESDRSGIAILRGSLAVVGSSERNRPTRTLGVLPLGSDGLPGVYHRHIGGESPDLPSAVAAGGGCEDPGCGWATGTRDRSTIGHST